MTETKTRILPSVVAAAFATVNDELPSTYPSRNPKFIYFLKPGHKPNELMRDEAWDKLPFDEFAPYVEKTGTTTSVAVYYSLRKEYQSNSPLPLAADARFWQNAII